MYVTYFIFFSPHSSPRHVHEVGGCRWHHQAPRPFRTRTHEDKLGKRGHAHHETLRFCFILYILCHIIHFVSYYTFFHIIHFISGTRTMKRSDFLLKFTGSFRMGMSKDVGPPFVKECLDVFKQYDLDYAPQNWTSYNGPFIDMARVLTTSRHRYLLILSTTINVFVLVLAAYRIISTALKVSFDLFFFSL